MLGLPCCAVLSLVAVSSGYSLVMEFSCCGSQALGYADFSSCGSWTWEHRLSSCGA